MHGIKRMTLISRKMNFVKGSKLDLRTPYWNQQFDSLSTGDDGASGKHGEPGATGRCGTRFYGLFH